jgi:hypothetical protein
LSGVGLVMDYYHVQKFDVVEIANERSIEGQFREGESRVRDKEDYRDGNIGKVAFANNEMNATTAENHPAWQTEVYYCNQVCLMDICLSGRSNSTLSQTKDGSLLSK